ncbi:MAG: LacI family DNA-binding transcriptional regulator [Planctomycetota bacterium]|jgi:DNA-binding LacI/PurR family transcriptional regulator
MPKANRAEVAKRAGVSEATVSRVFNAPNTVKVDKVAAVRAAARDLGYHPNKNASALRRNGTGVITFLENRAETFDPWPGNPFYHWFYADIIRALVTRIDDTLYQLRLQTVSTLEEIRVLGETYSCDGIIGFNIGDEGTASVLADTGLPYVCCHHTEALTGFNRCSTDNHHGGRLTAAHLAACGRCRVAYVLGGGDTTFSHRERWRGFQEGWGSRALRLVETEATAEGGYAAGQALIGEIRRKEIDAIAAVNDLTATGVIRALTEVGLRIPEDVGIMGYDNLPFTLALPFQPSSIDLGLNNLYTCALDLLIESIQTEAPIAYQQPPTLIKGTSG